MYLTADTVFPYLIQRGVLTAADVVGEEWFAVLADSKRPVLRVCQLNGRGFIVKQASPLDLTHVRMLDREAAFCDLAARDRWARPLRSLAPKLVAYDPGVHALVVELIPYDTGWDHLRRETVRPDELGRLLAQALCATHITLPPGGLRTGLFPRQLPWVLQLERAGEQDADQASVRTLLEVVKREPALGEAMARLAAGWQAQTLIHGDAKLDNVLVRMDRRPRLWMIDWAFAGEGDPAWDIGTVVRSCLLLWLFGIEFRRGESFAAAAERAVFPFALVRAFVQAFIAAYVTQQALPGRATDAFLRRAFAYAGAALVQSTMADARGRERLTRRQLAMLQMSIDLMDEPDRARRELFDVA